MRYDTSGSHMHPEVLHTTMVQFETKEGSTEYIETEYRSDIPDDCAVGCDVTGWFARLSAPGYLDRTDWYGPFATKVEAEDFIAEEFDINNDDPEV